MPSTRVLLRDISFTSLRIASSRTFVIVCVGIYSSQNEVIEDSVVLFIVISSTNKRKSFKAKRREKIRERYRLHKEGRVKESNS
jgi:hypothetical protein